MKRTLVAILFAACLATIFSCGPTDQAPVKPGAIERVENGLLSGAPVVGRPGASLEERMASLDVAAVSIAVIQDYEIVWAKAYGVADRATGRMADTKTLFQAASISKPVTATAVHQLAESGTLDLDAPVNQYLESWKLPENELNTELFPESFNTWDSLGEGYMTAGHTELAIANYEKSLELDPSNANAVAMLERLREE